jgi:demethylmenaquinone methyltransferase/2-methoxy-6-polyprenyl-1,4-benzoquinol methylase
LTEEVILSENSNIQTVVAETYRKRSRRYDLIVRIFNPLHRFGFDIPAWRDASIQALGLKPGDTVVDIGCGTGLTFPLLVKAVGPRGRIIGIDLSSDMLEQAQQRVRDNHWMNIELVCADASEYVFPQNLDGILSNFALILVPEVGQVVLNGCLALKPGGRFSILDMAWPTGWSFNWRHVLFWLRPLGLTLETLEKKPWESVWQAMEENLEEVTLNRYWYGSMYQTSGVRKNR